MVPESYYNLLKLFYGKFKTLYARNCIAGMKQMSEIQCVINYINLHN